MVTAIAKTSRMLSLSTVDELAPDFRVRLLRRLNVSGRFGIGADSRTCGARQDNQTTKGDTAHFDSHLSSLRDHFLKLGNDNS